jgi:hypothetical protein
MSGIIVVGNSLLGEVLSELMYWMLVQLFSCSVSELAVL